MYEQAMTEMKNPLSPVKMVRETYSKWLQRHVTEVQVQFRDEEPAWIPYETLLAIKENEVEFQRRVNEQKDNND
jgi:hypothetical protein|tara:strand:+ start:190 stop:411 length:222 start_codon:yes stop_codon:yes gene_type:complete